LYKEESKTRPILVIEGSHSIRESEALAKKGLEVISVAARGWRPNLTACEDMAANVAESVKLLSEEDYVAIHRFDNIAHRAHSEEGGYLPIRKFMTGDYHIEGDLVLASKERLFMHFKNCAEYSSFWRGLWCSSCLQCRDTYTSPAALERTSRRTSGRTDSRTG
jgi:hypothetical protein